MKFNKSLLSASAVLAGAFLLTGCGEKKETSGEASGNKTITIMAPLIGTEAPPKDTDLQKEIEKLTGYNLDFTWIPDSSYADKISITLASDKVPNIIVMKDKNSSLVSNIKRGAFWKLDEYLNDYPNLAKANKDLVLNSSFNGESYGIYRQRDLIRSCVIFRKDWLDKLGLQEPTNLEEFVEVLRQFTENDPDGNGKNDTYGLIVPKWPGTINTFSPFDQMSVWFGAPNVTKIENDKVVIDFMTPEYMDALDFFKMLYDKGYMNRDFAVMDAAKWDEPFVNSKAGVIIDMQSRAAVLQRKLLEKNGNDGKHGDSYVSITGNIETKNGNHILPTAGFYGMLTLPKQGVKNEQELKKVLDFVDKLNTKEGNDLLNSGVKDVYYTLESDKFNPKEDVRMTSAILAYSQLSTNTPGFPIYKKFVGSNLDFKRNELLESGKDIAVFNPTASLISDTYAKKGAQLQNIMSDARIQYIAGQIDKKGYQDAVDLWLKTGGQDYLNELTELFNKNLKK